MNNEGALRKDSKRGRLIAAPTRNSAVHAVGAAISRPVQELPQPKQTTYRRVREAVGYSVLRQQLVEDGGDQS